MAKNAMDKADFYQMRSQMDKASTPQDLLDVAAAFGIGLTGKQLDTLREIATDEVNAAKTRFTEDEQQHQLAARLRNIQNGGIESSSQFVNLILYQAAIWAVMVLFIGEVMRLTPVIATMLDTNWLVAIIPTGMVLIGYYVTAMVGKNERKQIKDTLITRRMKAAAQKYLHSETITAQEETEGRAAAELIRKHRTAGLGYGLVEWILFIGIHLLAAYHTYHVHKGETDLVLSMVGSVGFIFLLLVVSKMLVAHIFMTSQKAIVTGVQGFDKEGVYEDAYGRAIYRAILSKASAQVEEPENPTQARRVVQMPSALEQATR